MIQSISFSVVLLVFACFFSKNGIRVSWGKPHGFEPLSGSQAQKDAKEPADRSEEVINS